MVEQSFDMNPFKERPTWCTIYLQYILPNTCTCFGRIYSPSSGGKPYGYNSWCLLFLLYLLGWTQPGGDRGGAVVRVLCYKSEVSGSIPAGAIGIFHWHNPCDLTMALGSTQPLTEMNTRSIFWGKGGRCVRLTTLPLSCAVVMKSGNLNFVEPSGPLQACNGTDLPLPKYTF